jgi:ankyrin repeat protein
MDSIANKATRNGIIEALNHLPKGLDDTYREALQRIEAQNEDDRKLATRVLSWITYAVHPLSVVQLQHALAIKPGATRLDEGDIVDEEILLSICAGLVSIEQESGVIQLVHYTAQGFFERVGEDWFPDAQLDIVQSCLTYLLFDVFAGPCSTDEDLDARLKDNPLLIYAAMYWFRHTNAHIEHKLQNLILMFLKDESRILSNIQVTQYAIYFNMYNLTSCTSILPKKVSGLHVAATCGLATITRLLLADGVGVMAKDSEGRTALHRAANHGNEGVVRQLLERSDLDVNSKDHEKRTALHLAAWHNRDEVIRPLIERSDVDINSKNSLQQTPLHLAAARGHEAVVRLLMERSDVDINSKDYVDNTPLHSAAFRAHEAVMRLLMERSDLDVNSKNENGQTALHIAVKIGHEAVMRLLMKRNDVDVNSTDVKGRTPLHLAAKYGDEAVVRLLMKRNDVDVNSKNENGQTALHLAARFGHEAVVRLLMKRNDVVVNSTDDEGQTALDLAARFGIKSVVELFKTEAQ